MRKNNFITKDKNALQMNIRELSKADERYIDNRIMNIFLSVGISAHLQGYQYLKESIKLVIKDPSCINSVTKSMYPKVADKFATTPYRVERGIRHALDTAFIKGKIIQLNDVFGIKILSEGERPTNAEFVALLADKLSLEAGY